MTRSASCQSDSPNRGKPQDRSRGTVLVLVLGILTLLALVGVGLLASVRSERANLLLTRPTLAAPAVMDSVVELVRERLRADLWNNADTNGIPHGNITSGVPQYLSGNASLPPNAFATTNSPNSATTNSYGITAEDNEPFDAPGPFDRWLASTLPFLVRDPNTNTPHAVLVNGFGAYEYTIAWPHVSYLGSDVIQNTIVPGAPLTTLDFAWPANSRTGLFNGPALAVYGEAQLPGFNGAPLTTPNFNSSFSSYPLDAAVAGIPVILTPPTNYIAAFGYTPKQVITKDANTSHLGIPGATTEVTIAEARRIWNNIIPQAWRDAHRFPYFDTNMDGVIDLYDADGDGIPDSPISFILPYPAQRPDDPQRAYAVIRIIDNCSMVNVNVASSIGSPGGTVTDPLQNESSVDLQRRGRRTDEVILDNAVQTLDRGVRAAQVMGQRRDANTTGVSNLQYIINNERYVTRCKLIGGTVSSNGYNPFVDADESALRHRGILATPDQATFDKTTSLNDYSTVERALRWTTLWNPRWFTGANPSYDATTSWWRRLSDAPANGYALGGAGDPTYDLNPANAAGIHGWKTLVDEDSPWFIRRSLLTTKSYSSTRMAITPPDPDPLKDPAWQAWRTYLPTLALDELDLSSSTRVVKTFTTTNKLWDAPGNLLLREKVSLNPVFLSAGVPVEPGFVPQQKADYVAALATAIYLANVQTNWVVQPPSTSQINPFVGTNGQRVDFALQLALNIVDYADNDDEPTVLVDTATGAPRFVGLEAQPFLSKIYLKYNVNEARPPFNPVGNIQVAVELINPFPYQPLPGVVVPSRDPIKGMATSDATTNLYSLQFGPAPAAAAIPLRNPGTPLTNYVPWFDRNTGTPGRLVVASDNTLMSPPQPNAVLQLQAALATATTNGAINGGPIADATQDGNTSSGRHFTTYTKLDLQRTLHLANGYYAWVIDSWDYSDGNLNDDMLERPQTPPHSPAAYDVDTALERDDVGNNGAVGAPLRWKFTFDDWNKFSTCSFGTCQFPKNPPKNIVPQTFYPRLGMSNRGSISNFAPSQWFFRNTGYARTNGTGVYLWDGPALGTNGPGAFDSVADVSRILATGTRGPGVPSVSVATQFRSEDFASTNASTNNVALGRADFFANTNNATTSAGPLFNVLTCSSLSEDGIDNDGANGTDDALEPQRLNFRLAGPININTAPVSVLRAIPFMWNDDPANVNDYDLAAAIVAYRENRQVRSAFQPTQYVPVTLPYLPNPAALAVPFRAFRTLADLFDVGTNAAQTQQFNPWYYGYDLGPLPMAAHLPGVSNTYWSPNFDADSNSDYPTINNDIRERDIFLSRFANILTTRSDTFTVYIALLDENGNYLRRTQFTLDRSPCETEDLTATGSVNTNGARARILPTVLGRIDTDYANDLR